MEVWKYTQKSMRMKLMHRYVTLLTYGTRLFCNTNSYTIISFLINTAVPAAIRRQQIDISNVLIALDICFYWFIYFNAMNVHFIRNLTICYPLNSIYIKFCILLLFDSFYVI